MKWLLALQGVAVTLIFSWFNIGCVLQNKLLGKIGGSRPVINIDQKRPGDKRRLKSVTLNNQLEILIISDPDLNKSAASMDVGVGSLEDPLEHQGLAHFLEHMLFLGTKKYPDVEEYNRYLHSFQGSSNAYTAAEQTNYHFEINHEGFEGALDRFAQFFISPTLDQAYIDRERNAVHSEHQKNLQDDLWRANMVIRTLHKQGHPRQKFSTGDLSTLGGADQEVLRSFYNEYYSANRMKLAVMTKLNPEAGEQLVRKYFAAIPNHGRKKLQYDTQFFDPEDLPRVINIRSVKDLKKMTLLFAAPSNYEYWASKPGEMISHLIGYEGKGSLLSLLKKKNLATGLSAWPEVSTYGTLFHFDMTLTEDGLRKTDEVLEDFFGYVALLQEEGFRRYIYNEQKVMGDINFVYREHREGAHIAASYASRMQQFPGEEVEKRDLLLHQYSSEDYKLFLSHIRPEALNLIIQRADAEGNQKDKYYGTVYRIEKLKDDLLRRLQDPVQDPSLSLPGPNRFIPENLELLPGSTTEYPEKIMDDKRGIFWFQPDKRFQLPKANLQLLIFSKEVNYSASHKALSVLYAMALNESLNEWNYDISLAGLHYSITRMDKGIQLDISGYSGRFPYLLTELARKLRTIEISEQQFNALKNELKDGIANTSLDVAYQQLMYELRYLTLGDMHHRHEIYDPEKGVDLISGVSLARLHSFAGEIYKEIAVEGAAYGNLDKDQLLKSIDTIFQEMKPASLAREKQPKTRTIKLKSGRPLGWIMARPSLNHCWGMNLQLGDRNPALNAAIRIGHAYLKTSFFGELRTQQQLGYVVFSGLNYHEKGLGMLFLIQSSEYDPFEIERRIQAWKESALKGLSAISDDEFHSFKTAVAEELREKDKTMAEKHQTNVFEALIMGGQFDYKERVAAEAEKMTKGQVVDLFSRAFNPSEEGSLTVYLVSGKNPVHQRPRAELIPNTARYKREAAFFEGQPR